MPRILHASDLHFGRPSIPQQVQALESLAATAALDVFVLSGDVSQRTRTHEFERGRAFIARVEQRVPVLVVPGNHDVAWWMDPMGLGVHRAMYARYRRFIRNDLEPVLRVPGVTLVGLNSSHGIQPYTLTLRPRDLSVVGSLRPHQFRRAREAFATAPAGDLRVLVIHHNLLRGRISNRWGLANREGGIAQAAETGADLVLCGHDHEQRVEEFVHDGRRVVVACASTLTDRVRGNAPSAIHQVEADAGGLRVHVQEWSMKDLAFVTVRVEQFARGTR